MTACQYNLTRLIVIIIKTPHTNKGRAAALLEDVPTILSGIQSQQTFCGKVAITTVMLFPVWR